MKKLSKEQKQINEIMADWDGTEETPQMVRVVWKDASTIPGSSSLDEIKSKRLLRAETIGYLVCEDEESVSICGFLFPDPHVSIIDPRTDTIFRDVHSIPKKWIQAVIVLKADWEESKKFREDNKWLKK